MSSRTGHGSLSCSVVVCTRDRPQQLARCLHALEKQTFRPLEIIVIDNASSDRSAERIAADRGARYFYEPTIGLSRARNLGAAKSSGEIVAYIDDDAVADPEWLAEFLKIFQDSTVMAAGGRVIAPESDEQVRTLCRLIQGSGSLMELRVIDNSHPEFFEIVAFGGVGVGMNIAFRRSVFHNWPGFDERLGLPHAGCEELYAFLSIVDHGFRVAYVPGAVVTHPVPALKIEVLQKRYLAGCEHSMSYMAFLFMEEPRYRTKLLRFLVEGILGHSREWRGAAEAADVNTGVSSWRVFRARCRGILHYFNNSS